MAEDKPLIFLQHEFSSTDMLSDWLQAEKAVLWDLRAHGLRTQLQSRGLTTEELEELLLSLAADVHEHRTGIRAGAVIVENGMVRQLYHTIDRIDMNSPYEPQKSLLRALENLYNKRALQ